MKKFDLVIKAGILISTKEKILRDKYILVKDGKIKEISDFLDPEIEFKDFIDAGNCIVMPGLINCHTHLPMTLFRGISDDLPLRKWLFEVIFPLEKKKMNPETVYTGALLGCAELISFGTTCIADGYFFQEETIKALLKAGLRGIVGQGIADFPTPDIPDPEKNLFKAEEFLERWRKHSDLIIPSVFCHSPYSCSEDTLRGAKKLCEKYEVPLMIHLSETQEEVSEIVSKKKKRPVFYLDEIGILKEDLICVHVIHVDEKEVELLAKRNTKVVHVPESNMKLASGIFPVKKFLEKKVTVGIGTDGCASNNNLNLLCEIEMAGRLAKISEGDPSFLDSKTLFDMMTISGAKVLGMENEIGSIEVGKSADIITLDLSVPYMNPLYDPITAVVYSSNGGNIRDVIVKGRIVMRDKKIITLDVEEISDRIRYLSKKFLC